MEIKMKNLTLLLIIVFVFNTVVFAQVEESKYFEYLKTTYANKSGDETDFLITQFNEYLDSFPLSQHNDEIYYMLGEMYKNDRSYFKALVNYLKVIYLYSASAKAEEAKTNITQIVKDHEERSFEDIQSEFLAKIKEAKSSANASKSFFEYLMFIKSHKLDDLNEILISEIGYYLKYFGDKATNADQALFWQGELFQAEKDWTEASLSYKKLSSLFPNSMLIPQVIYNTALIEYQELSKPKAAKESFVQLISNYAESEFSGNSQFYLGELYEKEFRDNKEAISNYRLLVETYPANQFSVEALKRVAELLLDEEKYEEAIASYYQIVELYPQDEFSTEALVEIKDIYVRRLENHLKAIETLIFFANQYKSHEDAAEHLYDAAEIYYDDLNNKQAAIDTYHQVINDFSDSKYAEWAKDKIEDLSEE
jgi:TolA-binding protein